MAMAGILYIVEELPYILKFDASSSLCKYRMTWLPFRLRRWSYGMTQLVGTGLRNW